MKLKTFAGVYENTRSWQNEFLCQLGDNSGVVVKLVTNCLVGGILCVWQNVIAYANNEYIRVDLLGVKSNICIYLTNKTTGDNLKGYKCRCEQMQCTLAANVGC